jgi:hypothetical protein
VYPDDHNTAKLSALSACSAPPRDQVLRLGPHENRSRRGAEGAERRFAFGFCS